MTNKERKEVRWILIGFAVVIAIMISLSGCASDRSGCATEFVKDHPGDNGECQGHYLIHCHDSVYMVNFVNDTINTVKRIPTGKQ